MASILFPLLLITLQHHPASTFTPTSIHILPFTKRMKITLQTTTSDGTCITANLPPITKNCTVVSSMPPPIPTLKNNYYLLRHGQSTGNVAGVISSSREMARNDNHALTTLGYRQGRESAGPLLQKLKDDGMKKVVFYSSPFARARGTAEACLDGLKAEWKDEVEMLGLEVREEVILEDDLMERFFGRLDNEKLYTYAYVWPNDLFDTTHTAFGVESVAAVSTRIRDLVVDIDERHDDEAIVLVSHADVLQITQVYAAGVNNVGTFSQYRFGNGEVRVMGRSEESLPEAKPLLPPEKGT